MKAKARITLTVSPIFCVFSVEGDSFLFSRDDSKGVLKSLYTPREILVMHETASIDNHKQFFAETLGDYPL